MSIRAVRASQVKCWAVANAIAATSPATVRHRRRSTKNTISTQAVADSAAGNRTASASTRPPLTHPAAATSQ